MISRIRAVQSFTHGGGLQSLFMVCPGLDGQCACHGTSLGRQRIVDSADAEFWANELDTWLAARACYRLRSPSGNGNC